MQIDVEHVARLARLGLSDEEKKLFGEQLAAILTYADNLKKLNTDGVPPTTHAIPLKNVYRADKAAPSPDLPAIMAGAPDKADRMFRVPRIIE
ncbi:MAG: Asp-tRNA(Asn)/Glu-tRNA(Gln) amidotransferase subunit GatC [Candidatus Saganbacteria bacterium]|nr:Asp-tRNA(Asn)/Glu-tRNA(Gln) amidotransferase subunit GatC [Candidatus Saganbacteria bacterium]